MTTFIDVHILQDLPPSNINRDDNGTPKTCVYGGVERLRVSSQAWKRATRKHFETTMDRTDLGVRTRRIRGLLTHLLAQRGIEGEAAVEKINAALTAVGLAKTGKKDTDSQYLLFAGRKNLEALADALAGAPGDNAVDVAAILGSVHSLDVALFGRMVADMTKLNVDAAAQVAHAVSTHAAPTQFDYFTAVDDEQDQGETGAGMIGTLEFNSATMYRFATLGLEQLVDNMGDGQAAIDGVAHFIQSFAVSMPTGHQTSFAPRTRPALVLVVLRQDQPVNLVSAFERPVRAGQDGFMAASQRALAVVFTEESTRWGDTPRLVAASYATDKQAREQLEEAFGPSMDIAALVQKVTAELTAGSNV